VSRARVFDNSGQQRVEAIATGRGGWLCRDATTGIPVGFVVVLDKAKSYAQGRARISRFQALRYHLSDLVHGFCSPRHGHIVGAHSYVAKQ